MIGARLWPAFVVVAGALGCGGQTPAPDRPTWVHDVAPLLRANCFQCHGPSADYARFGTVRWDVYDLGDPRYAALGFSAAPDPSTGLRTFVGASDKSHFLTIPIWTSPAASDDGRMPPAPATRLSARDLQVLENWQKTGFDKGTHDPNHRPTISWLPTPRMFQVLDEDQDQVLGKLDCGGQAVSIPRSGGFILPEGVNPPCTGTLFDGFDEAAVDLR
jgi:hypothetical protein